MVLRAPAVPPSPERDRHGHIGKLTVALELRQGRVEFADSVGQRAVATVGNDLIGPAIEGLWIEQEQR